MAIEIIIPTINTGELNYVADIFFFGICIYFGAYLIYRGYGRGDPLAIILGLLAVIFTLTLVCIHYGLLVIKFQ
jgi:hypothetical protein